MHTLMMVVRKIILVVMIAAFLAPMHSTPAQALPVSLDPVDPPLEPVLLKDIYTADASSNPQSFFPFGDKFIFITENEETGYYQPWISDGTEGGTHLLSDFMAGQKYIPFMYFTLFRGRAFFLLGNVSNYSTEAIWSTDGTSTGTVMVYDPPGYVNPGISELTVLDDWLYFLCNNKLMRYGGPENETETLTPDEIQIHEKLISYDGALYFSGYQQTSGYELWKYDPATGTAELVKDLCANTCEDDDIRGSLPQNLTVANGLLFFTAADLDHGRRLWVTDGTTAGTRLVKDIRLGVNSPAADWLAAAGGFLYFTAIDDEHGKEIWRSDGSTENTMRVTDLAPGSASSRPQFLTALHGEDGDAIYFSALDGAPGVGHGVELWKLPVAPAGETAEPILLEIAPGKASSFPTSLAAVDGTLYFSAQDEPGNIELWASGGTPETTRRAADLLPGPDGAAPQNITAWGDRVVFSAIDPEAGREVWVSGGTPESSAMVKNIETGIYRKGSAPSAGIVANVGGRRIRYFVARDALHGEELWRSDGTGAGTWMVKDVYPGPQGGLYFFSEGCMAEMGGVLYFCGEDPEAGQNLWRSDGTEAGTWMLKQLAPGDEEAFPQNLTIAGGRLYFVAKHLRYGREIWVSDGAEAGTNVLKDIIAGTAAPRYERLVALGSKLIFMTRNCIECSSFRLWRSDGTPTGTQSFFLSKQGDTGYKDGGFYAYSVQGGLLYLNMILYPGGVSENRLWATDGTAAGTQPVISTTGEIYALQDYIFSAAGSLYFRANTPGQTWLWKVTSGTKTATPVAEYFLYRIVFAYSLDGRNVTFLTQGILDEYSTFFTFDPITKDMARFATKECAACDAQDPIYWHKKIYFHSLTPQSELVDRGLWATDGTSAGTGQVLNPETGEQFFRPNSFLSSDNSFYFTANDGQHGMEPWVIHFPMDNWYYVPNTLR